ncbi:MAG: right-handed parallel beta-helix repeat-containing protein, partial [Cytophagales bacterium]|nr:right-handed parallel beta-helix repeat-containing protein [Cytophagales bacterium]
TLDERGEVALLTRNILIQGDAASEVDNKGVYFMIMETAVAKVSGVELFRTGLGGVLARYPFHWHMANNVAGQYIKNSSIHRAYNRAITVHGSQNALVDNNVCYDVIGHAIFLEDGIEYGNTISSNFVASVKRPVSGRGLLASDTLVGVDNRATGPGGIWITHPDNVIINNHISGAGSGIWYALPANPTGFSFNNGKGIQNRKIPIRRFEYNSMHSCAVGLTFDYSSKQDSIGHIIGVETAHYDPTVYTLVQRIQSFKNIRGIWFRGSNQVGFSEFVLADNQGNGSFIPTFKSRFSNGCSIGYSANNTNINFPTFGTSFYDGAQEIYNCHFENFDQPNQSIFNIFGGANKSIYNQVSGFTYKK